MWTDPELVQLQPLEEYVSNNLNIPLNPATQLAYWLPDEYPRNGDGSY
jgi:hypothetical protein